MMNHIKKENPPLIKIKGNSKKEDLARVKMRRNTKKGKEDEKEKLIRKKREN